MENWIITSRQTFEEKLDNPHQRFKFHSLLIFGFTGVSISYFEPIFFTFIYLSTLLIVCWQTPACKPIPMQSPFCNIKSTCVTIKILLATTLGMLFEVLALVHRQDAQSFIQEQ